MKDPIQENIKLLEKKLGKKIYLIIFNPCFEDGIRGGDEKIFYDFIEKEIIKNKINNCSIILEGIGGDRNTSIICSSLLREKLSYYLCFIPNIACSSLGYFILQSNKLLIGKESILTQIDPIFNYGNKEYRAIKELTNVNNEIRAKANQTVSSNIEILKKILTKKKAIFSKDSFKKDGKIKLEKLEKVIQIFMTKEQHESKIRYSEIEELPINFEICSEEIIYLAKQITQDARMELINSEEKIRGMIRSRDKDYLF